MHTPPMETKLVVLIDSLGRGGAQRALVRMAGHWCASGFTVRVIGLSGDDDANFMHKLCQNASVCSIGKKSLLSGVGLWRVWRQVRQADLILTMLPFADQLGRVMGGLAGIPVISSERSLISFRPDFILFMDKFTGPLARHIVFNSREALRQASDRNMLRPEQGVYIPNGVAPDLPEAPSQILRAALGLPEKCRVLGSIGRFTEEKGTVYLVEAFAMLARRHPDLYLLLGGDGPLRGALEARVASENLSSRACLPGVRPAADLLACMDIFALPSLVEGMPNALMEAMLAGLPVVSSRVGATPDLVVESPHGLTGLLVPPGDAAALVHALEALLDDTDAAARMGAAGRTLMRQSFSVEASSAAYAALFRHVLQSPRNLSRQT